MISILRSFVNKPIRISIPALFGDEAPRIIKLIGIDPGGVWLACEDLGAMKLSEAGGPEKIFVPFAQIAYIALGGTPPAATPPHPPASTAPTRRRR